MTRASLVGLVVCGLFVLAAIAGVVIAGPPGSSDDNPPSYAPDTATKTGNAVVAGGDDIYVYNVRVRNTVTGVTEIVPCVLYSGYESVAIDCLEDSGGEP